MRIMIIFIHHRWQGCEYASADQSTTLKHIKVKHLSLNNIKTDATQASLWLEKVLIAVENPQAAVTQPDPSDEAALAVAALEQTIQSF